MPVSERDSLRCEAARGKLYNPIRIPTPSINAHGWVPELFSSHKFSMSQPESKPHSTRRSPVTAGEPYPYIASNDGNISSGSTNNAGESIIYTSFRGEFTS